MSSHQHRTHRPRRRGDGLIRGLILVAVVAVLGGLYVGWKRPHPKYPRVAPARQGAR